MGSCIVKQKNINNKEQKENHLLNEQYQEDRISTQQFLLQKGYNFAKFIQKNRLRDIILVYQYFNHEYAENIIIRVKSSQLKCYLKSFQNNEPYTYSTHIVEHFSNEDETIYFIVYKSSLFSLNNLSYIESFKLNDVLIINIQLLKIIEKLINNDIYDYPLDIYSIGYNKDKAELVLFDELFIQHFSKKQNIVNSESENLQVIFQSFKIIKFINKYQWCVGILFLLLLLIDQKNKKISIPLYNIFQILIYFNEKRILQEQINEEKQKATKDYLNRIGRREMNEKELIKEGKSQFKINDCKLMDKYLKNIFWKNIIGQKNIFWKNIIYQKSEENNLSKLMTEIKEIYPPLFKNLQSFTHQVKNMFTLQTSFIDYWNHQIYRNNYANLLCYSQLKDTLTMDIPSQYIKIQDKYSNQLISQTNEDLNKINGTIISFDFFDFYFKYEENEQFQKIIFIEFLKKFYKVQRLDLNFCEKKFSSEELISIFKSIKYCSSLISLRLRLSKCYLSIEACQELKQSLEEFVELRKLTLDLYENELSSLHLQHIMGGLKNCKLLTNVKLELRSNNIQFSQEYYIFSSFQYTPLTYLDLQIRSDYCKGILLHIGEALKKCQLLKVFRLKDYSLEKVDDDLIMFGNQIKQYPSLLNLELNWSYCKNTETVKLEFFKIISNHTLLNTIKIHFTFINYSRRSKSQQIENLFKKKKNFMNIQIQLRE